MCRTTATDQQQPLRLSPVERLESAISSRGVSIFESLDSGMLVSFCFQHPCCGARHGYLRLAPVLGRHSNTSSTVTLNAWASLNARSSEGEYVPVSIAMIVCRVTPHCFARCSWVMPGCCCRSSRTRLRMRELLKSALVCIAISLKYSSHTVKRTARREARERYRAEKIILTRH